MTLTFPSPTGPPLTKAAQRYAHRLTVLYPVAPETAAAVVRIAGKRARRIIATAALAQVSALLLAEWAPDLPSDSQEAVTLAKRLQCRVSQAAWGEQLRLAAKRLGGSRASAEAATAALGAMGYGIGVPDA